MVFMENSTYDGVHREGLNFTIEQEHAAQVAEAAHYSMVIVGWGEDEPENNYMNEEQKLAKILGEIKNKSASTHTVAYAGQFESIVPSYAAQRLVLTDHAYEGFILHDDNGKRLGGVGIPGVSGSIWDFRNESARAYFADQVAGFFARHPASDGVFFDGLYFYAVSCVVVSVSLMISDNMCECNT